MMIAADESTLHIQTLRINDEVRTNDLIMCSRSTYSVQFTNESSLKKINEVQKDGCYPVIVRPGRPLIFFGFRSRLEADRYDLRAH